MKIRTHIHNKAHFNVTLVDSVILLYREYDFMIKTENTHNINFILNEKKMEEKNGEKERDREREREREF
jgi:hypothetical protein